MNQCLVLRRTVASAPILISQSFVFASVLCESSVVHNDMISSVYI